MRSLFECKGNVDADFWSRAVDGKVSDQVKSFSDQPTDFQLFFCNVIQEWRDFVKDRNLSAMVDYPAAFFWRDLIRIFPDSKVILGVRSPESWKKSVLGSDLK